ncbi:MAG: hypothetical protein Q4A90_01675 [Streptococcus sp.]|nr:hypothetical protein [Streptococcus sp.]
MAKITIENLEGLSSYATSITNFTREYRNEVETFKRTFTDKVEGDQAEAIKAFFAKLNDLQTKVFDNFPEELDSYASLLNTYHDNISDIGFSTKAYSDDNDASKVSDLLKKDQLTAVTDITGKLKTAFQIAADAMGTDAESVDSIETDAASSLQAAATNRTDTDSKMQSAFTNFKTGLDSHTDKLEKLKGILENAKAITSIPLNTIFNAISKGILSADKMYYIGGVHTKEDVTVLKAILSQKEEDVKKIGELPPDKISDTTYVALADETSEWIRPNNTSGEKLISALLDGLGKRSYDENKTFYYKMIEATNGLAILNTKFIVGTIDNEYFDGNKDILNPYIDKESRLNDVTALMSGLDILKYGQQKTKTRLSYANMSPDFAIGGEYKILPQNPANNGNNTFYLNYTTKFSRDTDGKMILEFNLHYDNHVDTSIHSISVSDDKLEYNVDSSTVRIDRITQEQENVVQDAITEAAVDILGTAASIAAPPVAKPIVSLYADILKSKINSTSVAYAKQFKAVKSIGEKANIRKSLLASIEAVAELTDLTSKTSKEWNKLELEKQEEIASIKASYLNSGGAVYKNNSYGGSAKLSSNYNYKAALRKIELDNIGLMGYIKSNYIGNDYSVTSFVNRVNDNSKISEPMKSYILGENKYDLRFESFTFEQLKEFKEGINSINVPGTEERENSNFNEYLSSKYNSIPDLKNEVKDLEKQKEEWSRQAELRRENEKTIQIFKEIDNPLP